MKRNVLLNSFLLLVVSFFLFVVETKAEISLTLKYGDSLDVSEKLGKCDASGCKEIEKVILNPQGDLDSHDALDLSQCPNAQNRCIVTLKKDAGLWSTSGHFEILFKGESKPEFVYIGIIDKWPAVVSLGEFNTFNKPSGWGELTLSTVNSAAYEGKTREKIKLPFPTDGVDTKAKNGLPIVFKGFIKLTVEYEDSQEGSTFITGIPVQRPDMCEVGGFLDGIEGAYGEFVEGSDTGNAMVDGTGRVFYRACYEYVGFARLSLAGGEPTNPNDSYWNGTWKWDKATNTYITKSSGVTLPAPGCSSTVKFPFGLASSKCLTGWVNQYGEEYDGGAIELNGDVWSPTYDYDPDGGSINDRAIRLKEINTISSASSKVKSCKADINTFIKVHGVENDKCKIEGIKYEEGNITKISVTYENNETIVYNVTVIDGADEEEVYLNEVDVIDIQDEDPGEGDIIFRNCSSYSTGTWVHWGGSGKIKGTNLNRSIYYGKCNDGGAASPGLCIDPGAPSPGGATYIRDKSWDFMSGNNRFIALVSAIQDDIDHCGGSWGAASYGNDCQDMREGAQIVFRLLSVASGTAWNFGGHYDYEVFRGAARAAGINGMSVGTGITRAQARTALNKIFTGDRTNSNKAYTAARDYLYAYADANVPDEPDPNKFKITKNVDKYKKKGTNGYEFEVSGKLITPNGINIDTGPYNTDSAYLAKWGYEIKNLKFHKEADGSYTYKATMNIPSALPKDLKVPTSASDKKAASIQVKLSGGKTIKDIFVIKPRSGAHLQRLLFFDKGTSYLLIFFGPDVTERYCNDLTSTMLETCEKEAIDAEYENNNKESTVKNKESATCNFKLFRKCCNLVDEGSYPSAYFNICTNSCSYNTLGSVCGFNPYGEGNEGATMYHIREGYKRNASIGTGEDGKHTVNSAKFNMNIGTCVVNVNQLTSSNADEFTKRDGAGNIINVKAYESNRYCRVTCREEWDLTLGSFGSYMGAEAVRAGGSFQIDKSDLFIRGDRYCYTSYLNPDSYKSEMSGYSSTLVSNFNEYSKASHGYSDLVDYTDKMDNSVTQKSATGGSTDAGLDGTQACRKWKKITYTHIKTTKLSCSSGTRYDDKCYSESHYKNGVTGSCPDGYSDWGTSYYYSCKKEIGDAKYVADDTEESENWECTNHSSRKDKIDQSDGSITIVEPYKDKATPSIKYYGQFNSAGQFNGGCGAGNYTTSSGCSSPYYMYSGTVTCTITVNQTEGGKDKVKCSYPGATSKQWNAAADIIDKINKKSVGYVDPSGKTMSGAGASTYVGVFFNSAKSQLEGIISSARANMANAASNMNGAAADWYDCQNFILYTDNYTGTALNEVGDLGNATVLAGYGLNANFKALGSRKEPVKILTSFNPKVSYYYDEEYYVQLMQSEKNIAALGIEGNILVRNDKKNTAVKKGKMESEITNSESKEFFDPSHPLANIGNEYPVELTLNAGEISKLTEAQYQAERKNILTVSSKGARFIHASSPWPSNSDAAKSYGAGSSSNSAGSLSSQSITLCSIGGHADGAGDSAPYSLSSGGDAGYRWASGSSCFSGKIYWYANTNYIERSVKNSSFFKNKGNWYNRGNGIASHGERVKGNEGAINVYNKFAGSSFATTDDKEIAKWGKMGTKNIFPVSLTTPRNLYKYTYTFANIGSYYDVGSYGRLMGNKNSVFKSNSRTCFYEVIEQMCKCCGDKSINHVVYAETVDKDVTPRFAENHKAELGPIMSDDGKIENSNQGQVGFYNTVSSLTNLSAVSDGGGERKLAANWSESSLFNYNGYNRYVTNKGDVALKAIEAVGEEIYSPTYAAEYAYRLTPDAISDIKEDNKINNYGTNFDDKHVKLYGKVKVAPKNPATDIAKTASEQASMAEEISFGHYGSVFLEELSKKYAKPSSDDGTFTNLDLASRTDATSNVCYIDEKTEVTGDGQATANKLKAKLGNVSSGKCRWVDFVEDSGDADDNYMDTYYNGKDSCSGISDGTKKKSCQADYRVQSTFRLAFK